ncbi:MAG: type II toxin-antitoxin system HicA family toxin [Elusimicrobia bacterium]|nr:type II toxin-antitoxin system HicA family toxin [Candidatus Obscuribacterium magneticum]
MARLPVVSGPELIKALQKHGFNVVRQRGSHVVLQQRKENMSVTTVVPNHKELARGTLLSILRKVQISPEELVKILTVVLGINPLLR